MIPFDHLVLVVLGWLADHSPPVIAGFIGGIVGAEVRARVRRPDAER